MTFVGHLASSSTVPDAFQAYAGPVLAIPESTCCFHLLVTRSPKLYLSSVLAFTVRGSTPSSSIRLFLMGAGAHLLLFPVASISTTYWILLFNVSTSANMFHLERQTEKDANPSLLPSPLRQASPKSRLHPVCGLHSSTHPGLMPAPLSLDPFSTPPTSATCGTPVYPSHCQFPSLDIL